MAKSKNLPLFAAAAVGVVLIVVIRLLSSGGDDPAPGADPGVAAPVEEFVPREGCVTVTVAASSEKAALMAELAQDYAASGRVVSGVCYDVDVNSVASGTGEANLAAGWDENLSGVAPDVWSPAASTWVSLLQTDLAAGDRPNIVPTTSASVTSTPLVLAMPRPMAEALGWPTAELGWADVLELANDPKGWAGKGHPEWGKFTLGKTNPNVSTSGLAATIGALVAATGVSSDLSKEDLADPKVQQYLKSVEHSVVHYGDTTLTYLSNLQRADDSGAAMGYVSAVAVEEKSVLDYNAGNPTGNPATLGDHAPPAVPLVAIYPKEGTLYSDSPYVVLDAPWSTAQKKAGAADFLEYLQAPERQKSFTDANFRTFDHQPGAPITNSDAVKADGVTIELNPPGPEVLAEVRNVWAKVRKSARVLLLLDVSGSMNEASGKAGKSKLQLAQDAARSALGQLSDTDEVGLWTFSTQMNSPSTIWTELVPVEPLAQGRQTLDTTIANLIPVKGTPLYAATRAAAQEMTSTADPDLINAVVLLTDGKNEYSGDNDLDGLVDELASAANEDGVRVFSIAYGEDADLDTLKEISEASRAAAYDARNAQSIDTVFANVLSNF